MGISRFDLKYAVSSVCSEHELKYYAIIINYLEQRRLINE